MVEIRANVVSINTCCQALLLLSSSAWRQPAQALLRGLRRETERRRMSILSIDDWIVNGLERFCHRTQRAVGMTASRWCQIALLISSLFAVKLVMTAQNSPLKWILIVVGLIALASSFLRFITVAPKPEISDSKKTTANSLKSPDAKISRTLELLVGLFCLWIDIERGNFWYEFSVLASYLAACDDLPTAPSKLRQFLESLSGSQVTATEDAV